MKTSINVNELRDFADKLPKSKRDYLHAVADELSLVRMQRNIAVRQARALEAASRREVI